MIIRHAPRLYLARASGRVLVSEPEFLFRLAVDHRRPAFLDRNVVASLQGGAEILRPCHVLAVCAERFPNFVVPEILLEQMDGHRLAVASVSGPGTPRVVIVDDHDHRQPVLAQGIHLHRSVTEPGISRNAYHWVT